MIWAFFIYLNLDKEKCKNEIKYLREIFAFLSNWVCEYLKCWNFKNKHLKDVNRIKNGLAKTKRKEIKITFEKKSNRFVYKAES